MNCRRPDLANVDAAADFARVGGIVVVGGVVMAGGLVYAFVQQER